MSLEVGLKKTRLISLEGYLVLLLGLGDPGFWWMFSEPDLLQKVSLFRLLIGNINFSPFIGVNTSFALSLFAKISDASICSNSSMSATKMSPFQILFACNAYPKEIYLCKTLGPN